MASNPLFLQFRMTRTSEGSEVVAWFRVVVAGVVLFALFAPWASTSDAAETPATGTDRALTQLLAHSEDEPLISIVMPDAAAVGPKWAGTNLGRLLLDQRFADGRVELFKGLSRFLGAEIPPFWGAVAAHLKGPAALVLTATRPTAAGPDAAFRLTLLLGVADPASASAVLQAWPHVAPQSGTLFAVTKLETAEFDKLEASSAEVPAWVKGLVISATHADIHLSVKAGALASQMKAWSAREGDSTDEWSSLLISGLMDERVERVSWSLCAHQTHFIERLQFKLDDKADGAFARLLLGMKEHPSAWKGLQQALPGRLDASLLMQLALPSFSDRLTLGLCLLERALRGKKWTRLQGEDPDVVHPDRFKFVTDHASGTFGVTGQLSLSGEVRLVAASATPHIPVAEVRRQLSAGLSAIGMPFRNQDRVTPIGEQVPLAATTKGRSFLPAPMIGLSDGWVWLCSSPSAYQDLITAFATGVTLASESSLGGGMAPYPDHGLVPQERGSVQFHANLTRTVPLLYTAWLLSEDGPHIGEWKVPAQMLPPHLGLFQGRLGVLRAELGRRGRLIEGFAHSPLPGGALLLAGLFRYVANGIEALEQGSAENLRKRLEKLNAESAAPDSINPPKALESEERP